MAINKTNMYDIEAHIAEIYDKQQNHANDIGLIKKLITNHVSHTNDRLTTLETSMKNFKYAVAIGMTIVTTIAAILGRFGW